MEGEEPNPFGGGMCPYMSLDMQCSLIVQVGLSEQVFAMIGESLKTHKELWFGLNGE